MSLPLLVLVALVAALLLLAAIPTKPLEIPPDEAATIIRDWLRGEAERSTYDEFLSCRIADPRVEKARDTFYDLLNDEHADDPPAFLTPEGVGQATALAEELERFG